MLALVKAGFAVVAALGTFRLVRSYDAPPAAAYVAAVAVPMGGMTQYLDLPSWAAGEMIWALLPWVWWALRRTMLRGANPLPALVLGYLLVSVGYVFGTIMLIVVLAACLFDCLLRRDRAALGRVLLSGVLFGLVAVTVYLPGVLSASVTSRDGGLRLRRQVHHRPAHAAGVGPADHRGAGHDEPSDALAYLVWFLPAAVWIDWGRARREWRPIGGLLLFTVATPGHRRRAVQAGAAAVAAPPPAVPRRRPRRAARRGLAPVRRPGDRARLALSLAWVALGGVCAVVRGPSMWVGHLCVGRAGGRGPGADLVAGGPGPARLGGARGRRPHVGGLRAPARLLPDPPTPQRNSPTDVAAYQAVLAGAVGDTFQVGAVGRRGQGSPRPPTSS